MINSEILKRIFDEDENILLQAIAMLAGKSPKANALPKNLEKSDIDAYWDKAINGFNYIIEVLDSIGVGLKKNTLLLPYKPILPLFAALSVHNKIDETTKIDYRPDFNEKIASSFSNRYTEGTDAKIQKDFIDMNNWIKNNIVPEVVSNGIIWNTEKYIGYSTNSAFGKSVLCLINSNNPKDFYYKNDTVGNSLSAKESQLHHLFPKANYCKKNINEKRLNTIFNFTFITNETNNFIKDRDTSTYIKEIEQKWGEVALKDLLVAHFIDNKCYDYLVAEDFEKFIHQRAEIIREKLSKIIKVSTVEEEKIEIYSD